MLILFGSSFRPLRGHARSHRYREHPEGNEIPVGAGEPAKRSVQAYPCAKTHNGCAKSRVSLTKLRTKMDRDKNKKRARGCTCHQPILSSTTWS
ncbi:hypothetical protein E8E78_23505 [Pseudomonas sp. BN505]|nr:hypothetical protein [Pseudomonas sp. BN605]MDH4859527.1 hypothetical protein [Pseudomonas sp. BN505]